MFAPPSTMGEEVVSASEQTHWAILIGVGVRAVSADQVLRGAARDVFIAREYLKSQSIDSKSVDISLFAAGESPSGKGSNSDLDPELLPTYRNVVSALQRVIRLGKRGQFVYIHFSGHGTRFPLSDDEQKSYSESGICALALVLYDKSLRGTVLRTALQQMGDQGMLVTLVLDCCFSGSVLRNPNDKPRHAGIRFLKFDPDIDAVPEHEDPFASAPSNGSELRSAHIEDPLALLKPDTYAVLAACAPHEYAREIKIGGVSRGALSYFLFDMLQTLAQCGAQITHQSLHQHLCARFHAELPDQTPIRYGSNDFSFFQGLSPTIPGQSFVPVFRDRTDGRLVLSAGQAHGVHVADEYAAYRYHASENGDVVDGQNESVKVVVSAVECLTSELVLTNPSEDARIKKGSPWKARCLNCYTLQKVRVRLAPSVPATDREELAKAARQHPLLQLFVDENEMEPCVLQVSVNQNSAYEVQNAASKPIPSLPTLALGAVGTRIALMDMLGHLVTFKYFERIMNRAPDRAFDKSSFSLEYSHAPGRRGYVEVKDGDTWTMTFRNLDKRDTDYKYITVFNLNPSWRVSNLVSQAGGGDYRIVPPEKGPHSGVLRLPMKMRVPAHIRDGQLGEGRGESGPVAEDVVKVFITSRPTTFPAMILPPLGEPVVRSGTDQLARLLQELKNANMREGGVVAKWACENITIRTSL